MTLYDIDESIAALIDPETGEITDYDALDALTMAREDKIKQIIFALRNAEAEAVVIRCEIDRLGDKLETAERGVESVKKYLEYALRGEKYKDATTSIYYRETEAVVVEEGATLPEEYLRYGKPTVNRTAISEALRGGINVPGASLEKRRTMIIK